MPFGPRFLPLRRVFITSEGGKFPPLDVSKNLTVESKFGHFIRDRPVVQEQPEIRDEGIARK